MSIEMGEPRMLIGGKLVEAASGKTFDNVNPATEEVIGQVADASPQDMADAIGAARRAFDESDWATDATFRRRCLEQLQRGLAEERETIRALSVAEVGCPVMLTYAVHTDRPISDLSWAIGLADSYPYDLSLGEAEVFGSRHRRMVWREAVGVVGAITPWNYPLQINLAKIGPALAAGNTVVLKPAPDTPWTATVMGRVIAERTDIPPGVVNVVTSSDHGVGEVLTGDPRVDMISFTGSTATGRRGMTRAAETVKKTFLELGGKSAYVVLDDADFASVVPAAAGVVCTHAGQGCGLTTRLLLPRSRYEEGVEMARQTLGAIPWGDPTDPSNMMGPLISRRQQERVLGYIGRGLSEGARLVVGGPGPPAGRDRGFWVEPTLFVDVDSRATIAQEEIFGPVLAVIAFEDDDDAVRIANDTIYGLSGAVASASEERALDVARRLRTGTVGVNGGMWFAPDSPFGGYRQSGIGREMGIQGFEEYLEVKTVGLPA
ncbi:MAG: aldehyde dehydrogenase family protein [Acidimicrobiales bacterium]